MNKNYKLTKEMVEDLDDLFSGYDSIDVDTLTYQMHQNELIIDFDNEFQFRYNDGYEVRLIILNGLREFDESELRLFEIMREKAEEVCDIVFLDVKEFYLTDENGNEVPLSSLEERFKGKKED